MLLLLVGISAAAGIAYLAGERAERATGAARIAYTKLTVERGRVFNARFSPDGKTVFCSAAWNGRPVEVFETSPGFYTSRAVGLPQTNLLSLSSSGRMAVTLGHTGFIGFYQSWGTLAELTISGGAPRRLLDDVLSGDWSPDGNMLAISHRVGGKARLEMPPGHVLYETPGGLSYVRVAPSGKWLAFVDNTVRSGSPTRDSVGAKKPSERRSSGVTSCRRRRMHCWRSCASRISPWCTRWSGEPSMRSPRWTICCRAAAGTRQTSCGSIPGGTRCGATRGFRRYSRSTRSRNDTIGRIAARAL